MKALRTSFFVVLLVLAACKPSGVFIVPLTDDEAANMVAASLAANTNGLVNISGDITINAQAAFNSNIGCGATKTYTLTDKSPQGSSSTYNYGLSYTYTINCNAGNQFDNITGTSTDNGSFENERIASTNNGSSTFRVAGLTSTASSYVVNGEYKRTGTFTSKVSIKSTGTSGVDILINNLTINKSTNQITSGSATVTLTGTTSSNGPITYNGAITFSGSNKASVNLNGVVYNIDLMTGVVTK